jgi:hypothetical protein
LSGGFCPRGYFARGAFVLFPYNSIYIIFQLMTLQKMKNSILSEQFRNSIDKSLREETSIP